MADLTITNIDVISTVNAENGVAGEAIAKYSVLYLNSTDNKFYLSSNDVNDATSIATHLALTTSILDGQLLVIDIRRDYVLALTGPTLVVGSIYVLSSTPGKIAPEADLVTGDRVTVIGYGSTAANLFTASKATLIQKP